MKTDRRREWFDDDAFWRELYPFMFPARRFEEAEEQAAQVFALAQPGNSHEGGRHGRSAGVPPAGRARILRRAGGTPALPFVAQEVCDHQENCGAQPPGPAVLDLCCGPGRFSTALARRGCRVTGVDRTPFLLNKARRRARAAKVAVEWVRQDMRDFVRPGAFDLALSMFTSFGYFDDPAEDLVVLRHLRESLKPGGVCLIDAMGKEGLARVFQPTLSEQLPDGTLLVQRHEIVDDWSRIRNQWVLVRRGRAKAFEFTLRVYSGAEMRGLMEQAGFRDIRLYGDLAGGEYGAAAVHLVAIGRKPGSPWNA